MGFVVILFGPDPALDKMNMCPSRNKSRRYLFLKMKKKNDLKTHKICFIIGPPDLHYLSYIFMFAVGNNRSCMKYYSAFIVSVLKKSCFFQTIFFLFKY